MKKSVSIETPPKFYDFGKTKQVNYNVSEKEQEGVLTYEYNVLTVDSLDYDHIVRKLMAEKYSIEDEIALINNHISDAEAYAASYQEYQQYRSECKTLATQIISDL